MKQFSTLYPKVTQLIDGMPFPKETFLFDRLSNVDYPFWIELEHFLSISERLGNICEIIRKLCSEAPLCLDIDKAWEKQRDFRSAQFEVTSIFLIEQYFRGKVALIPENRFPTPDFLIDLSQGGFTVEAKAQSGQQHGDKHPRLHGPVLFDPKEEIDLRSWLFEERISSRNGKPMKPQILAAERKGADVLICQTDYVKTRDDLLTRISILCPESYLMKRISLQSVNGKAMDVAFFHATYPSAQPLTKLKEIWLCNLSRSSYGLVVLSRGNADILSNHLEYKRKHRH